MRSYLEMWIVYGDDNRILGIYPDRDSGMIAYATDPSAVSLVPYIHYENEESEESDG